MMLDFWQFFVMVILLQANLIGQIDSESLIIALEPEVAGLVCRDVKTAYYQRSNGRMELPTSGDSYLIIDVGGNIVSSFFFFIF